jgi:hypothetical protein
MQSFSPLKADERFSLRAVDILAALNCLNYLIGEDAEDSVKVRHYAGMAQERLQALGELSEPALGNTAFDSVPAAWPVQ